MQKYIHTLYLDTYSNTSKTTKRTPRSGRVRVLIDLLLCKMFMLAFKHEHTFTLPNVKPWIHYQIPKSVMYAEDHHAYTQIDRANSPSGLRIR